MSPQDSTTEPPLYFITICSKCDRIKLMDTWLDVADSVFCLDKLASQKLKISHGMCSECYEQALLENT